MVKGHTILACDTSSRPQSFHQHFSNSNIAITPIRNDSKSNQEGTIILIDDTPFRLNTHIVISHSSHKINQGEHPLSSIHIIIKFHQNIKMTYIFHSISDNFSLPILQNEDLNIHFRHIGHNYQQGLDNASLENRGLRSLYNNLTCVSNAKTQGACSTVKSSTSLRLKMLRKKVKAAVTIYKKNLENPKCIYLKYYHT